MTENGTEQNLERGGRGEAGAFEDIRGSVSVKSADSKPFFPESGRHPPYQRRRTVPFLRFDGQLFQLHHVHRISLRLDADPSAGTGGSHRDHVEIHTGGQHPAVIVVGVIAADLGTSGRGEQAQVRPVPKAVHKGLDGAAVAFALIGEAAGTVQPGKQRVKRPAVQCFEQFFA